VNTPANETTLETMTAKCPLFCCKRLIKKIRKQQTEFTNRKLILTES